MVAANPPRFVSWKNLSARLLDVRSSRSDTQTFRQEWLTSFSPCWDHKNDWFGSLKWLGRQIIRKKFSNDITINDINVTSRARLALLGHFKYLIVSCWLTIRRSNDVFCHACCLHFCARPRLFMNNLFECINGSERGQNISSTNTFWKGQLFWRNTVNGSNHEVDTSSWRRHLVWLDILCLQQSSDNCHCLITYWVTVLVSFPAPTISNNYTIDDSNSSSRLLAKKSWVLVG